MRNRANLPQGLSTSQPACILAQNFVELFQAGLDGEVQTISRGEGV